MSLGDVHGPIRLLADDLTGALDSAAAFGAGVPVHLDHPQAGSGPAAPVEVVATASRDVAASALPALLAPSRDWLRGAALAFKKVDSLLRGNTLDEVAWLARAGGFRRVVFAPAFPAQGRFLVEGRLAVAPAGAGVAAAEPRGPQLAPRLRQALPAHCTLELPEIARDADLESLLERLTPDTLWCGSAGLAGALARRLGAGTPSAPAEPMPTSAPWAIGASHQPVTRRQWAQAAAVWPNAQVLRHGDPAGFEALCEALAAQPHQPALIDLSPLAPMTAAEAAALLQAQATQLAQLPRPEHLLVLGGDTARALARATGVVSLRTGRPLRPGWGRAQWCGGRWDGLWMDARSGAFGDDHDLQAALEAIRPPGPGD
ncbi:MAG: hypothetical protein RL654_1108 [Pseudomonadota bacterium]|jgi:uncharacterized protein YgbK (DUF1537 family)